MISRREHDWQDDLINMIIWLHPHNVLRIDPQFIFNQKVRFFSNSFDP